MGKSHFVLLVLCSLTLNIETGLTTTKTTKTTTTATTATKVIRCYGCIDPDPLFYDQRHILPKDAPKCSDDGYGKEFDCSGDVLGMLVPLCGKLVQNGKSD